MSDSPSQPMTDSAMKLSPDQEAALDSHFRRNKNIYASDVAILSAETGLPEEQVQQWFTNRLSCWRREQGLGPLIGRAYE